MINVCRDVRIYSLFLERGNTNFNYSKEDDLNRKNRFDNRDLCLLSLDKKRDRSLTVVNLFIISSMG